MSRLKDIKKYNTPELQDNSLDPLVVEGVTTIYTQDFVMRDFSINKTKEMVVKYLESHSQYHLLKEEVTLLSIFTNGENVIRTEDLLLRLNEATCQSDEVDAIKDLLKRFSKPVRLYNTLVNAISEEIHVIERAKLPSLN